MVKEQAQEVSELPLLYLILIGAGLVIFLIIVIVICRSVCGRKAELREVKESNGEETSPHAINRIPAMN